MIVYLAGPITGLTFDQAQKWRHYVERMCPAHWTCLDPLRDFEHLRPVGPLPDTFQGEFDAVKRDLEDIDTSNAVLVNLTGALRVSIGTMCELGYAHARGKFIVTVLDSVPVFGGTVENPHDHLFVRQLSDAIVPTLDEAIAVIEERERDYLSLAS